MMTSDIRTSALFSKLQPSIRDNTIGASYGDLWFEAASWTGLAALLKIDDSDARRGLASFFADVGLNAVDDRAWQDFLHTLTVELERTNRQRASVKIIRAPCLPGAALFLLPQIVVTPPPPGLFIA